MQFSVGNGVTRCSLHMQFRRRTNTGVWDSARTDTFANEKWAAVKLALPIKVTAQVGPQLLIKLYRPDWLDYELYAIANDGVERAFTYSCRDEKTIRWIVSDGRLKGIVTFDRFAVPPPVLERHMRVGTRLQLREVWRYDGDLGRWLVRKRQWTTYKFGASPPNPVLRRPADCTFRYR